MDENVKKEKKERYLLIFCGGSGKPDKIIDFFENKYQDKEYYDILTNAGSVLPLIIPNLNDYCPLEYLSDEDLNIFKDFANLYNSLILQIRYYIKKHKLTKVVVIGETGCAFYEDLLFYVDDNKLKVNGLFRPLPPQRALFVYVLEKLRNLLDNEFKITDLEAWFIDYFGDVIRFYKMII